MKRKPGLGRGVLHAQHGASAFAVKRFEPSESLAPFVEHIWTVRWDRRGQPPFTQVNLPDPAIHLSFERSQSGNKAPGDVDARLLGPSAGKFVKVLDGWGHAFAVKFRPGGLRRFWDGSIGDLREKTLPAVDVFGASIVALQASLVDDRPTFRPPPNAPRANIEAKLDASLDATLDAKDEARAAALDAALQRWAQFPVDQRELAVVQRVCEALQCDRTLLTVKEAAAREGVSVRTLQRLFHQSVGYAPKWILQRGRLQDAAQRLAETDVAVTTLAHDLGFADAAHFARAFKALTGLAPVRFRAQARALMPPLASGLVG